MNSHHAPRDIRRNFETTSIGSPECENKKAPGYILDYGQPYVTFLFTHSFSSYFVGSLFIVTYCFPCY